MSFGISNALDGAENGFLWQDVSDNKSSDKEMRQKFFKITLMIVASQLHQM